MINNEKEKCPVCKKEMTISKFLIRDENNKTIWVCNDCYLKEEK